MGINKLELDKPNGRECWGERLACGLLSLEWIVLATETPVGRGLLVIDHGALAGRSKSRYHEQGLEDE
jgi:hypothetical protein